MDQRSGETSDWVPSLADLLRRVADGDRRAFRMLYERQVSRLTGVALRLTGDAALARDAVQEAFLQIWRYADRFDPARGSAEAWLLSIARYRALAIRRKVSRETTVASAPEAADDSPDALVRLLRSREGAALHACLAELDAASRRLIVLAFVEGLSHRDLAQTLRIPLGTIKSSLRRSLIKLRRCLER